jgi:diadenosine tetraphosphatase ApaH/serine/threonine PP2A family protein phosphatase
MRILVISDIHANLPALEAVLQAAGPVDATWCLGDLVGYGPDPNACIDLVRQQPGLICLKGNHDAAAIDQIDVDAFNTDARASVHWLRSQLTASSLEFLRSLPERSVQRNVTLVHGSPRNPVWEYIQDSRTASQNFEFFDTDFCLVGHTHIPILYLQPEGVAFAHPTFPDYLEDNPLEPRAILNPGSTGQPRDRDPRASFAIFDPDASHWEHHRVEYDIPSVQKRILDARLPIRHAQRLGEGW